MAREKVSVIFSFRNEEDNLPEMIRRLQAMSEGRPEEFEFIFVDDVSTDRSHEILLAARASDARVKILGMAMRSGTAECVFAGMAAASGDAVVYMDCDLQDPPELIPTLIEHWRKGADVVHTARTARHGENRWRMRLTRAAYEVIRWASRGQMPVECGDFKLLSRRAVGHLLSLKEQDPYIRGLAVWIGFNQVFVPYERQPRHGGSSKFGGLHRNAIKTMVVGITSFSFVPVFIMLGCGLAGLGLAALLLFGGIVAALGGGAAAAWLWAALAFAMWGSLMATAGVLGVYIGRIYKDVRGRPRWIVGEAVGIEGVPDLVNARPVDRGRPAE